jgi:hypothetical protein
MQLFIMRFLWSCKCDAVRHFVPHFVLKFIQNTSHAWRKFGVKWRNAMFIFGYFGADRFVLTA